MNGICETQDLGILCAKILEYKTCSQEPLKISLLDVAKKAQCSGL